MRAMALIMSKREAISGADRVATIGSKMSFLRLLDTLNNHHAVPGKEIILYHFRAQQIGHIEDHKYFEAASR